MLLISQMIFATEFEAVVRSMKGKVSVEKVILKDLVSDSSFEGKFFKIVNGKSNEAIKFNDDKDLTFRAANVYYHLTKAKDFFVDQLKDEYVKSQSQMTIRINLTNGFHEFTHFTHDNADKNYNNALTIPAGKGREEQGIASWGNEIWFRPAKSIHRKDLAKQNFRSNHSYKQVLKKFREQSKIQTMQRFLVGLLEGTLTVQGESFVESIFRIGGTSIMAEVAVRSSDRVTKMFSKKWYHLDAALVPEIIYHEYAHHALSDTIELFHSLPVNEGIADYFAAQIAGSHKLAHKIKKYNTFNSKNGKAEELYDSSYESNLFANADFVFSLLWQLNDLLGTETAQSLIYSATNNLTTSSDIRNDLVDELLDQCKDKCPNYNTTRYRLWDYFHHRGL